MTPTTDTWPLFVTAARSLETQLETELTELGATDARVSRGGVHCVADLETLYRICHRSRLASRVLLPVAEFAAADEAALYQGCLSVDWSAVLAPGSSLAVDFASSRSALTHTRFGAQRVKDGIVDQLREARGERPDVDRQQPDCRINAYLFDNRASLSLDLGGGALHRRPWLAEDARPAIAPNLASALLMKSGWARVDGPSAHCVSLWAQDATLAIEAAEIALGAAANRDRDHWGFLGWLAHDADAWSREQHAALLDESDCELHITAVEPDRRAGGVALAAIRASGMPVVLEAAEPQEWLAQASVPPDAFIAATPVGRVADDTALWPALGDTLKQHAVGCRAGVLAPDVELGKQLGIRAAKRNQYQLSDTTAAWLQLSLRDDQFIDRAAAEQRRQAREHDAAIERGAGALVNRIRKNQRTLGKWAQRNGISCYRLYDADLPEYALAVDLYGDHAHIQEYAAPSSIDPKRAAQRLADAMAVLPNVLGIDAERCVLKQRQRQRGDAQYRKQDNTGNFMRVSEGPATFAVNLHDYLDTGLFLDHRETRQQVARLARGKRLLNLFGYTGSVTVQAALAGATDSLTVDKSQTYLDWAGRNFSLNKLDGRRHRLERGDVPSWLAHHRERYGVIFLDPPTFSNSKGLDTTFDVQRDHVSIIRDALACLEPGGTLVFSNNNRRFRLDSDALDDCSLDNISHKTLPRDFARNPRIHNVWLIRPADR